VRASAAVDQAVTLISKLLEKGIAYYFTYEGAKNVYFDPQKFRGFGKLAHLDISKWAKKKRRFHKDTYPGTPWNRGDFVLWHGCEQNDVCYQTPIGQGRPAWNIQDTAIVTKYLGFTVDVGCGGIDNLVRHHDYTLAVAEAVSGKQFSKYWLHGGHLLVEGKKMSKSKGNVYYPRDLLAKGFSGEQIRFFLIYGSYRKRRNFTFEKFGETIKKIDSFRRMVAELQETKPSIQAENHDALISRITADFEANMNNDLDVKGAFDSLAKTISELYEMRELLSLKDVKNALNNLQKADSVLRCII
jgi:cysteinyl-tRNA synthetase